MVGILEFRDLSFHFGANTAKKLKNLNQAEQKPLQKSLDLKSHSTPENYWYQLITQVEEKTFSRGSWHIPFLEAKLV